MQARVHILGHASAAVSQLSPGSSSHSGATSEDCSESVLESDAESVRVACIHMLRSALGEGSIVPDVSPSVDDDALWTAWYGSSTLTDQCEGSVALVATTCKSSGADGEGERAGEQDGGDNDQARVEGQEQLDAEKMSESTTGGCYRSSARAANSGSSARDSFGVVLGCCTVRRSRAGRGTNIAEVSVVVAPSQRCQGIGTQLLAASLARAGDMGYAAVCTPPVPHTDVAALTILARAGFQQVGTIPAALPVGPDTAADLLLLHLSLAQGVSPRNAVGAGADMKRRSMPASGTSTVPAFNSSAPDFVPTRGPFRHVRAHSQPFGNSRVLEAGFGAGLGLHGSPTLHAPLSAAALQSDGRRTSSGHVRGTSIGAVEGFSASSAASGTAGMGLSVHAASWLQQQQQQQK